MAVSDRIAVMNEGSVVQEGSAEDLYHRPATEFVARFVGRVNLVPGRVAQIDGAGGSVAALGSVIGVRALPAGLAAGDRVRLVLRPEAIAFAPPGIDPAAPAATVASRTFLGEKVEYVVTCGGESLQVVRYNAGAAVAEGAAVALVVADDAVTVLPESAR